MDPCKENEPQVINNSMIARCLEEQGLKGELGRLAREEGIPWDEVKHILLEFMNILRIDHLWVLPSLTTLSLSSNLLENIENLNMLVHLTELNLSFNKIKKIENLEDLIHLENLNLFNNLIEKIENLDSQTSLLIFSIGNNRIQSKESVLYLRQFKKLKSVNLAGNPCIEEGGKFRNFIATFLPNILYYEYKMIEDDEREEGMKIYAQELADLEEAEVLSNERRAKLEAEIAEAELYADSFVEFLGTSHLFDQMFEDDKDGLMLLKIGEESKEFFGEFQVQFCNLCRQIFETGQEMYKTRKKEVDQFTQITEGAKLKNQDESICHMEEFMAKKRAIFDNIKDIKLQFDDKELNMENYQINLEQIRIKFAEQLHITWKVLMRIEMTLFEQLEETNQNFEQTLTEMVNNFIEMAQGYFAQMRSAEGNYNEMITELAQRYLTTIAVTPEFVVPEEIAPIFVDRDSLMNAVGASHDVHLLMIDNREDRLVHRARNWLSNLVNDLQKNEITRDRAKVLEINHYLDIQREEFEEIALIQEISTEL